MESSKTLQQLLLEQLEGGNAHITFQKAVQGLSYQQSGAKVDGLPHTIWQLIEHIRLAQDDILAFCGNRNYQQLNWPEDYWPSSEQPESQQEFEQSLEAVHEGQETMRQWVTDPSKDLQKPFSHGDGQTLFREALLIVDHNAYHIGQIVQLRRLLGCW
ncbi:MAG TPA: DinB family protein [Fodinibius sp.]|nr:DinB family protein [Fodinibius sp.]